MRTADRLKRMDEVVLNRRVPTSALLVLLVLCGAAVAFGIWAGVSGSHGFWPEPIAIGVGVGVVTVAALLKRE